MYDVFSIPITEYTPEMELLFTIAGKKRRRKTRLIKNCHRWAIHPYKRHPC